MHGMSHNPIVIIKANPKELRITGGPEQFLRVSEFFCDTIQGENFVGYPAAFLRLQDCTMNCSWCDTRSVWRYGNPYIFDELYNLMDLADLPRKLSDGQHLVLTGGSPLLQQQELVLFIRGFVKRYDFLPHIEIENECTIYPDIALIDLVSTWNNSPKLSNSHNAREVRYRPAILSVLSELRNSWFKFVISSEKDWDEIEEDFLGPRYIKKGQVVLMPVGGSRSELESNRETVVSIAVKHNVRYSTREHVVLWDKMTGV
jgi:organic radical activating enzyme